MTVINAGAAATLPQPLRCRFSALPTELSKPHESGCIRVSPLYVEVILGPSIVKTEIKFCPLVANEF